MESLRIIFAGTTNFSACYLNTLIHSQHKIIAVFTQLSPSNKYEKFIYKQSIRDIIKKHKLQMFQENTLNTNKIINTIKNLNPDIIIVVSYGLIIPKEIIKLPQFGCINVHGSLLPRWRGPAPIQRALQSGDTKTGISIIQMDSGIDTGNILHKSIYNILPNDTSLDIFNKLAPIGSIALLKTLQQIINGQCTSMPQNDTLSTYAKKINKNEGKINWNTTTLQLERQIRAFNPWPISYFQIRGQRIKILKAEINDIEKKRNNIISGTILSVQKRGVIISTNDGSLIITLVQQEGKKIMPMSELLNSKKHWFTPGLVLNSN